jgi:hypothetical protein
MSVFEFYPYVRDWLESYEAMRCILSHRNWNWTNRDRQWGNDAAAYLVGFVRFFCRSVKVKVVHNFLTFSLAIELPLKPVGDLFAFHVLLGYSDWPVLMISYLRRV